MIIIVFNSRCIIQNVIKDINGLFVIDKTLKLELTYWQLVISCDKINNMAAAWKVITYMTNIINVILVSFVCDIYDINIKANIILWQLKCP